MTRLAASDELDIVYKESYPVGSQVKIVPRAALEEFQRTWRLHNPLQPEQLAFGDATATVERVGYYFGGDVLYWLKGIPGTWHECCLAAVPDR